MNNKYKYHGMWPVAPTPFHNNGEVDYEGMDRVIDCMVDQKVEGICILANYSKKNIKFIPYYKWSNRGENEMLVWVNEK